MTINNASASYQGLFGRVGKGGTVKNITLSGANVTGKDYVGALICYNDGGTISNNNVTGTTTVTGRCYIGGLVGINYGTVSGNTVTGTTTVTGRCYIGGLIGFNNNKGIASENTVTGATVKGNADRIGGLIGDNSGTVSKNTVTGTTTVTGRCYIGGLIGYNGGTVSGNTVTGTTTVTGKYYIGGLIGFNASGSTASGNTAITSSVSGTGSNVGGFAGSNNGAVDATNYYYSSVADSSGATRLFTLSLPSGVTASGSTKTIDGETYYYGAVTLTGETGKSIRSVTGVTGGTTNENGTYTFTPTADTTISAVEYYFSGGSGTEDDPYQIATAADLAQLATDVNAGNNYSGKYFQVTADIDLNGVTYTPIGNNSNPFQGNFDGNSKTISNLTIDSTEDYQGLFGCVGEGGTVKNVTLENANVTGNEYVGALVGSNYGNVSDNTVTGATVTGSNYGVGGLIGFNSSSGEVNSNEITGATVNGTGNNVGGLVGWNDGGTVSDNTVIVNSVTGNYNNVGGLIGQNYDSTVSGNTAITQSVKGGSYVGGLIGANEGGTASATNYYYSSATDSSGATRLFKLTLPSGVTASGSTKAVDNVTYYYGAITLTGETGKAIRSVAGVTGGTTNANGTYTLTPTADVSISAVEYYFSGGLGTSENPYKIANAADLAQLATDVNAGTTYEGKYFQVTDNIDLSGIANWTPIGNISKSFRGNVDGNSKTISGLKINSSASYQGLFGCVGSSGVVQNVTLDGATVNGDRYVGGLIGQNDYTATISGNTVIGSVISGGEDIGGLLGTTGGTVSGNTAITKSITVTGTGENIGGFAGVNNSDVDATNYFYSDKADTSDATRLFKVTTSTSETITSAPTKTIDSVNYYSGTITFTTTQTPDFGYVLGFTGATESNGVYSLALTEDTTIASVFTLDTAGHYVLASDTSTLATAENTANTPALIQVYKLTVPSTATITGATKIGDDYYAQSGTAITLSSADEAFVISSVTNGVSGGAVTDGGTYTFTMPATDTSISEIVYVDAVNLDGAGTEASPYLIASAADLKELADYVRKSNGASGKHFKVTADITDWTGVDFAPIGNETNQFKGTFDGNNKTISGLTLNNASADYQGLFGYVGEGGTVQKVNLIGANVTGKNNVGGLVGYNAGTVSGNIAIATVSGTNNFGALIGANSGTASGNFYYSSTADTSGATRLYTLSLPEIVTATTEPVITVSDVKYYPSGSITLNASTGAALGNVTGVENAAADSSGKITFTLASDVAITAGNIYYEITAQGVTVASANKITLSDADYYQNGTALAVTAKNGYVTEISSVTVTGAQTITAALDETNHYVFGATGNYTLATSANVAANNYPDLIQAYKVTLPSGVTATGDDIYCTEGGAAYVELDGAISIGGQSYTIVRDTDFAQVNYIDGGETQTATAYVLTGAESSLGAGWYVAQENLNYTEALSLTGATNLILADGISITTGAISGSSSLNIFAQENGTGTLTAGNISGLSNFSFSGGQVTAAGISATNIALDWTKTTDFIQAASYTGNVTIASGKLFKGAENNFYFGALTAAPANVKLSPQPTSGTLGNVTWEISGENFDTLTISGTGALTATEEIPWALVKNISIGENVTGVVLSENLSGAVNITGFGSGKEITFASAISGVADSGENLVVTAGSATVTISGVNLTTNGDAWHIDDTNSAIYSGGNAIYAPTTIAGASQSGNTINFTDAATGTALVELSGVATAPEFSGETLKFVAANFAGDSISVISNGGGYQFEVQSNASGKIFLGSAGNDIITNYAGSVSINGGAGNDEINLGGGASVTINVAQGNDIINLSGVRDFTAVEFAAGDEIDLGSRASAPVTIDGGIRSGNVTVRGVEDVYTEQDVWVGFVYQGQTLPGAQADGTKIIYNASNSRANLFTATGLTSTDWASVDTNAKTLYLTAWNVSTENISVNSGYKIVLPAGLVNVITDAAWAKSGSDLVYTSYGESGGFASAEGAAISYAPPVTATNFTLEGLSVDVANNSVAGVTVNLNANKTSGSVVLGNAALPTTTTTVKLTGAGYTLALANDVLTTKTLDVAVHWEAGGDKGLQLRCGQFQGLLRAERQRIGLQRGERRRNFSDDYRLEK